MANSNEVLVRIEIPTYYAPILSENHVFHDRVSSKMGVENYEVFKSNIRTHERNHYEHYSEIIKNETYGINVSSFLLEENIMMSGTIDEIYQGTYQALKKGYLTTYELNEEEMTPEQIEEMQTAVLSNVSTALDARILYMIDEKMNECYGGTAQAKEESVQQETGFDEAENEQQFFQGGVPCSQEEQQAIINDPESARQDE